MNSGEREREKKLFAVQFAVNKKKTLTQQLNKHAEHADTYNISDVTEDV